jgi:hypothetical protein
MDAIGTQCPWKESRPLLHSCRCPLSASRDAAGKVDVAVTVTIDREVRKLDDGPLGWGIEKVVSTSTERLGSATRRCSLEVSRYQAVVRVEALASTPSHFIRCRRRKGTQLASVDPKRVASVASPFRPRCPRCRLYDSPALRISEIRI